MAKPNQRVDGDVVKGSQSNYRPEHRLYEPPSEKHCDRCGEKLAVTGIGRQCVNPHCGVAFQS